MLDQMREDTNRPTKKELRKDDYRKLWSRFLRSQCVGADSPYGAPPANVVSATPGVIDTGLWSVPGDYAAGVYSTTAPVAEGCKWLIYRSGTRLEKVLAGDYAVGGYPTVRLSKGQQFSTSGCGTWSKDIDHPKVSSFSDGVWLVGRDVKPGRYKVESRLRLGDDEYCSWALYRGGTNVDDLLTSDYVRGGRPEVILRNGQEFVTDGCGTWSRRSQ